MEQSGYGRLDAEFLPILISNLKTFFFSSSPNVNTIYGSSETHPDGHNPDHMILLWTAPWLEKKSEHERHCKHTSSSGGRVCHYICLMFLTGDVKNILFPDGVST